MPSQSLSFQKRMIAQAKARQDTDLYFYLEYTKAGRTAPAAVGGVVPVVKVDGDYDAAPEWAHLMLELARHFTPGASLATALTTRELLDELLLHRWREWAPIDVVCPFCGGINCPTDCLPAGYSIVRECPEEEHGPWKT